MKHKVSDLEGALLDAAVAKAEGLEFEIVHQKVWGVGGITIVNSTPACRVGADYFEPSTLWAQGGPILERERITVIATDGLFHEGPLQWCAACGPYGHYIDDSLPMNEDGAMTGPTPLIAAMRAYCMSVFGDEVEL